MPPKKSKFFAADGAATPMVLAPAAGPGSTKRRRFRIPGDDDKKPPALVAASTDQGPPATTNAAVAQPPREPVPAALASSARDERLEPSTPGTSLKRSLAQADEEGESPEKVQLPSAPASDPKASSQQPGADTQTPKASTALPATPVAAGGVDVPRAAATGHVVPSARLAHDTLASPAPPAQVQASPARIASSETGTRIAPTMAAARVAASASAATVSVKMETVPSSAVGAVASKSGSAPGAGTLPLQGVVVCFTGELDNTDRQEAEEKIKAAGGKIGSAVSSNTTYFVVGSHLDDGRNVEETSKYRKYTELKNKGKKCPEKLDEAGLVALLGQHAPSPAARCESPTSQPATCATSPSSTTGPIAPAVSAANRVPQPLPGVGVRELSNWVDAHAPRSLGDLVGNAPAVRKLAEWLRDWDSVVLRGNKKQVAFRPGGGTPENVNARAVLLSGPPGIGKTTTARLVAKLQGNYEVLEYNASDARGMKVIQDMADGIADNTTISFGSAATSKKLSGFTKRACIIMDEVDGMGAGDRGGNAALIKMIKKTRNPIICICNDAHSQKIRSLAFSCYDLKFTRPPKGNVAQRCAEVAKREGLSVEPNALEALAESCGGDMRMILNQLQALAKSAAYNASAITYTDMKQRISSISKDGGVMLTPFDACKKLLNSSESARLSFRERMDMFFVDFSLVGLLTQENYLKSVERKDDSDTLNRCAYSADLITLGDIMNARITANQEWSLLPDVGLASTVYLAHVTNGFVSFPSFPQFLGKYSTMSRMRRLASELQAHLQLASTVGVRNLATSGYSELLYRKMVNPLLRADSSAVSEAVGVLDAYGLRKEHLQEHLTEMRQHLGEEDMFKLVDSKVKAAVTREFNSGGHAMKVLVPKGKKRRISADPDELGEEMDGETGGANADEGDAMSDKESGDEGVGSMVKIKGKPKAKGKAKAKAKAAAGGSAGEASTARAPKPQGKAKARSRR